MVHNSVGAGNFAGAAVVMRHWPLLYKQWKIAMQDPGEFNMFLQLTTGIIVYLSTDDNQVMELRKIDGLVDEVSELMRHSDKFLHIRLAILLANMGVIIVHSDSSCSH